MARKAIPADIKLLVLTEAGYRCAVPTCRQILAIDLHHIVEVAEGGSNDPTNLLAICPTCHALYHRGTIKRESIAIWKNMLVVLNSAFDRETIDKLLFLEMPSTRQLKLNAEGVTMFYRLIGAGLASHSACSVKAPIARAMQTQKYTVSLTPRGKQLIAAWKSGERERFTQLLGAE